MTRATQISAQISHTTRELMDKYVRRTGLKKGYLVEQALVSKETGSDLLEQRTKIRHPRSGN